MINCSTTEGDPCLLGETLHLQFPSSSSAVSSRLPTEQHSQRFQVMSPPKLSPDGRENFWRTYKSTSPTAHEGKSFFELFLNNKVPTLLKRPPLFSYKKLIISTPRLVQGLRTMSLAKAVLKGIRDKECKRFTLQERPPVPFVPEKDPVQETVSVLKSDQSLKTTIRVDAELCLHI